MNLVIADFKIRFESDSELYMDEGYTPFVNEVRAGEPDLYVECISGIPEGLLDDCETLFEARNDQQRFYSVVKHDKGLGFKLFNQQTIDDIQQLALLDDTYKHWKIYSEPRPDGSLEPMKYPMGPILLYYLVVNNNAIMIHSSGVFDGNKGRIFTGFSGTGKSTMAEQWRGCGSSIVNDDRLIVRKGADGFYMHNTPMYYFDLPKSAPLDAIHLIRHFPENITQRITGAKAVSKVMAFCIQNNFDRQFIQNYIGFITELCDKVGIYETGFVPDHSIVRYLQTHE
jgi:hypothetical protein